MGLPVEAMAIILATDRITDAGCTVTNVVGNTVAGILCSVGEDQPEIPPTLAGDTSNKLEGKADMC